LLDVRLEDSLQEPVVDVLIEAERLPIDRGQILENSPFGGEPLVEALRAHVAGQPAADAANFLQVAIDQLLELRIERLLRGGCGLRRGRVAPDGGKRAGHERTAGK